MLKSAAREWGVRIAHCLELENYDAARAMVFSAQCDHARRTHKDPWLEPFVLLGLDPRIAGMLERAQLYCPRDIERETYTSLQEIHGVGPGMALTIVRLLDDLRAGVI